MDGGAVVEMVFCSAVVSPPCISGTTISPGPCCEFGVGLTGDSIDWVSAWGGEAGDCWLSACPAASSTAGAQVASCSVPPHSFIRLKECKFILVCVSMIRYTIK